LRAHQQHHDAERGTEQLATEKVIRVLIARESEDGARGIDHDDARRGEHQRQDDEPAIAAIHARASLSRSRSTSLLNRAPRSSKSRNMSNDAQPGESSTTPCGPPG